ncbi:rod shape-determining protein MreC [Bacillus sp. CGMCC 1.16607]|uniref:rod shape-determining protein MreC n=1 Tax=Bacillus sp. CGMCC 1.16607 TaxID=3351842 RepID=UPI003645B91F
MPQFFLNKRLIILLVSIIILVALIGFSLRDRNQLTWPEKFVKDSTGLVQSLVSKPTHFVAGFFENLKDLQVTYNENKELKKRLDKLASLEAQVHLLDNENKELRDILDKKETLRDFDPIQATVVARNPDKWHEMIVINKGKVDGMKKNMPVITSKGLIGKVKSISTFTSTVQLLSTMDPKYRISAIIQADKEIFGLVEGYDEKRELLLIKTIPHNADIKKGQNVVSSGLGGVFPEGLVIGKVVEVVPDQYGLNQTAYIKPGANFYDIENVIVITRKMIQPDFSEMVDDEEEEL